jgi:16S rRNA (uracil1498-N3)-methyltransferase
MTRRRWIADEFAGDHAVLLGAHAAHLARILRARVGQEFEVACGEHVYRGIVARVADELVEFALHEELPFRAAPPITLLLAVFKFDRLEWAIEKCTELNVTEIVPVIARRTEKRLAQASEKRVERWRRIAREAAEQSRRPVPPEILAPRKLAAALAEEADLRVVLAENERETELIEVLRAGASLPPQGKEAGANSTNIGAAKQASGNHADSAFSLALAIGPEGGWTPEELQDFESSQWVAASLGSTILRAETAAIAALAVARAEMG